MNGANIRSASLNIRNVIRFVKTPVRIASCCVIACVVYLSAQAYLAIPAPELEPAIDVDTQSLELVVEPPKVVEQTLPPVHYSHPPAPRLVSHQIKRGDTLGRLLAQSGTAASDINRIITCKGECRQLHNLKTGTLLDIRLNQDGRLLTIGQSLALGQMRQFHFLSDRIDVTHSELDRQSVKTFNHVVIRAGESPISAAYRAGGPKESTVVRATQILEYDIDFWRNIRPDDEFEIYYEQVFINDQHSHDGDIYVLRFVNRGKHFAAYLHSDGMHYEADGSAIRKQFLKAPLRYKRISSNFSSARKHPILGYTRAHRGVDYAAPRGTPVRSTADGVVTKVVRNDPGAGNYLAIKHSNGFVTRYMHLKGFAKGIGRGTRVSRGSTIAYVGSTGLSTGPHLHYEVIKDGRHLNPLSVPNPSIESLEGDERTKFLETVTAYSEAIEQLRQARQPVESVAVAQ